jgi:hypothetical protein
MVRVRHCVECPKCHTRYLPGFTPYRNGSYLIPLTKGFPAMDPVLFLWQAAYFHTMELEGV